MLKKRWVIYLFFAAYIQWKMHQIKFGLDHKVKSTGFSPTILGNLGSIPTHSSLLILRVEFGVGRKILSFATRLGSPPWVTMIHCQRTSLRMATVGVRPAGWTTRD